jgi:hypothetical protein
MKFTSIYLFTTFGILFFFSTLLVSCENKNSPEYVTKQYLLALKDKDWEKAKRYSTKEIWTMLDFMKKNGTEVGITEVKDINCTMDKKGHTDYSFAKCYFCCSSDTNFRCLELTNKEDHTWKVFLVKEGEGCR